MTGLNTFIRTTKRARPQVGRGGKRGKTAGRGTKGQKARAGNRRRPELRDIIKKLPKRRGFGKNRARTVNAGRRPVATLSLEVLSEAFASGDTVTPAKLVAADVVRARGGSVPRIKVLAVGTLDKKLTLEGVEASGAAKQAIEKAGGSIA